jgi:type II secretory pathway pseudopilin PulG
LPELLMALSCGVLLAGMVMQALLVEVRGSAQLGQRLQQRALAQRALDLIRSDVARAEQVLLAGDGGRASCRLAGRTHLLEARSAMGSVSYSVGAAPSAIWRGQVLMRCGPAFGLDGEPSTGSVQNRVVLDGLERGALQADRPSEGVVRLSLAGPGQLQQWMAAQ